MWRACKCDPDGPHESLHGLSLRESHLAAMGVQASLCHHLEMTTPSFGEQVPWFRAPALQGNPRYAFESAAGRTILLFLCGSAGWTECLATLAEVKEHREIFNDKDAAFFGISNDPSDIEDGRIAQQLPGIRWLLDHDGHISRLYGVADDEQGKEVCYQPCLLLLDHRLRVVERFAVGDARRAIEATRAQMLCGSEAPCAPVLVIPRVFEPEVCRYLIQLYDAKGGRDSVFMRERDGMTVPVLDHGFKRRADYVIEDLQLQQALKTRLANRLVPEIKRSFQFEATHIERWLVACYDGSAGGFFKAHRDNTTRGTAHRRFACTINLNSEDYDGGNLRFPEFGNREYRAPSGGAVVFSCSLLHEATPVTSGRRYAFLPFLYDAQAQSIREQNRHYVADGALP